VTSSPTEHQPDRRARAARRLSVTGVLGALALAIAACGTGSTGASPTQATALPTESPSATPTESPTGSSESSPSPTATASATPAAAVDPRADGLDVNFGEFAITLESSVIRPGKVTLVVHNAGELTHGFEMKLERHGGNSGGGDDKDRGKIETRTFRSGETLRVEADLEPGQYDVECYISNHASRGMQTQLEVRADAPLSTPTAGATTPGSVRVVQFAMVPAQLNVPVGTSVTWTNDDPAPHTVTADDGSFDSKQLDPGKPFSTVFDTPGTFAYHCEIHPTMVGEVRVQ
jgi:plastocyanin